MSQMPDSSAPSPTSAPAPSTRDASPPMTRLQRNVKQLGLLLAGAGFMAASIAVARRSVLRRQLESFPKFYSGNRVVHKVDSGERSLMAVQALGLATLNVTSFGIMLTGGIAWAFDLCELRELRERTQAALRRPGNFSKGDEQEMEKMMASVLDRLGMQKPGAAGGQPDAAEEETAQEGGAPEK